MKKGPVFRYGLAGTLRSPQKATGPFNGIFGFLSLLAIVRGNRSGVNQRDAGSHIECVIHSGKP